MGGGAENNLAGRGAFIGHQGIQGKYWYPFKINPAMDTNSTQRAAAKETNGYFAIM
jgi:hypothetical protein